MVDTWPSDTKQDLNGHNAIGPVQLLSLYEECNKDKFWQMTKGMLPTMNRVNTLVLQRNKAMMKKEGVLIRPCTAVGYIHFLSYRP